MMVHRFYAALLPIGPIAEITTMYTAWDYRLQAWVLLIQKAMDCATQSIAALARIFPSNA